MNENTSTLQIVLNCIKELTANTGMAPRAAIIETTGLSPHIIKERIDELLESGQIKRRERGVYQHVTVFPPARAISRTVLPDGLAVIEVGDTVLHLTPHEEKRLSSMYGSGSTVEYITTTQKTKITVLRTEDVAEILGCTCRMVEDKAEAGLLPGFCLGGDDAWRFPADALNKAINDMAASRKQPAKKAS